MADRTVHAESDTRYWSRDYWLAHCEGFRVDSPDGRLGVVELALADEHGEPAGLVVRAGIFGKRLVNVPRECVVEIRPQDARVVVDVDEDIAA